MIRAGAPKVLALGLFACLLAAGCAAPGEPTARHPVVPAAVTDLAARQSGNAFALTFTLPQRSTDREALAEHPAIEIYRAALAPGAVPDKKTAWRLAYSIPPEQVDAYLKAGQIEFRDVLAPDDFASPAGSSLAYKVRTRAVKTRDSQDSNVVLAKVYPAPEAPGDVRVQVTESALVVSWSQAAVPPGASSRVYRVYRREAETAEETPLQQNVSNAKLQTPLELEGTSPSGEFRDSHFEFGTAYLYTVRSVAQFGADLVESADSAPVTVTPRDTFPPATPTGLEATAVPATPQAPAYVELSWAISPEGDLAGYNVYRAEGIDSPGERENKDLLPTPTFRDISVAPGRRFYYRVSAVDRAGNESPQSPVVTADVP